MQYNFKPINIVADSPEKVVFPEAKDRVIEKRGHVVEFTLNEVEANTRILEKTKKELTAKRDLDAAKMENIESFHPFVKEMSEQDLHTAWMYFESKGIVKVCEKKIKEIQEQMESDAEEVAEIKAQIPELNVAPIVEEANRIINGQN